MKRVAMIFAVAALSACAQAPQQRRPVVYSPAVIPNPAMEALNQQMHWAQIQNARRRQPMNCTVTPGLYGASTIHCQ